MLTRRLFSTIASQASTARTLSDGHVASAIPKNLKRFWNDVSVKHAPPAYAVLLDGRSLKTPAGRPLTIHSSTLAQLIAVEWDSQDKVLKPASLPLTSLVARAIDAFQFDQKTRSDTIAYLGKYLDTDAICFQQSFPDTLVALQSQYWSPIIQWANKTYNVDIKPSLSLLQPAPSKETKKKLLGVVSEWDHMKLAGFERAVMTSKSFLIGMALMERHISVEFAAKASRVEVLAQIEHWGEVEDSHDLDEQDVKKQLGSSVAWSF